MACGPTVWGPIGPQWGWGGDNCHKVGAGAVLTGVWVNRIRLMDNQKTLCPTLVPHITDELEVQTLIYKTEKYK